MGKFNLSSVYTSDNIYSVLKLLKALIDTLDTYSFEEPILDKDGNPIPMDWFKNLYNSIHGDSNGNVEIGKDAHVDGNINVDGQATIGKELNLGSRAFFAKVLSPSNTMTLPAIFVRNDNSSLSAFSFDPNRGYILLWEIFTADNIENEVYTTNRNPFIIDMDYLSNIDEEVNELRETITSDYQRKLVSGENIKTIFNNSILGAGNIDVPIISLTSTEDTEERYVLTGEKYTSGFAFAKFNSILVPFYGNANAVKNIEGNSLTVDDFDGDTISFINTRYDGKIGEGSALYLDAYSRNYIDGNIQKKLFIHTIHIQGALSDGGLPFNVCLTALLNNNTPIDSVQDLTTQLNGTRYACTGYATSHPVYIDIGATAAATVICVTDDTGARDIALSAVSNISIQDNVFTTA